MGVAERGKLEVIHDAFQMLIHSLTDDELVEAGIAISCGIVERLTDIQTAQDTRDHVRAYIWGIIDAYINFKTEVHHGRF